jgi:hypothetical protein
MARRALCALLPLALLVALASAGRLAPRSETPALKLPRLAPTENNAAAVKVSWAAMRDGQGGWQGSLAGTILCLASRARRIRAPS